MNRPKISIIGSGNVGGALAQFLVSEDFADIILYDRNEGMAKGKALDLLQAGAVTNFSGSIFGTADFQDTKNSDILVVTAGMSRKPGMSRDELLKVNRDIVQEVVSKSAPLSPNGILIVVTNPLDAMVYVGWKASGYPSRRILGMAGILDSSRMRTFIAQALGVGVKDVTAMVLGGHGDTMVPITRLANVNGVPVTALLPKEKIDAIVQRTRDGGAEIVALLQTGSAFYAPGAAVMEMCRAILHDEKRVLPCAAYLNGEYGAKDLFIGVPVVLGRDGVEKIIEIPLNDEERTAFQKTVEHVKILIASLFC